MANSGFLGKSRTEQTYFSVQSLIYQLSCLNDFLIQRWYLCVWESLIDWIFLLLLGFFSPPLPARKDLGPGFHLSYVYGPVSQYLFQTYKHASQARPSHCENYRRLLFQAPPVTNCKGRKTCLSNFKKNKYRKSSKATAILIDFLFSFFFFWWWWWSLLSVEVNPSLAPFPFLSLTVDLLHGLQLQQREALWHDEGTN